MCSNACHSNDYLSLSPHAVPARIIPTISTVSDSEITVHWNNSETGIVLRYIVDVREYNDDGPGKVRIDSLQGYPKRVSGTALNHTVDSLSKSVLLGSVCGVEVVSSCRG